MQFNGWQLRGVWRFVWEGGYGRPADGMERNGMILSSAGSFCFGKAVMKGVLPMAIAILLLAVVQVL